MGTQADEPSLWQAVAGLESSEPDERSRERGGELYTVVQRLRRDHMHLHISMQTRAAVLPHHTSWRCHCHQAIPLGTGHTSTNVAGVQCRQHQMNQCSLPSVQYNMAGKGTVIPHRSVILGRSGKQILHKGRSKHWGSSRFALVSAAAAGRLLRTLLANDRIDGPQSSKELANLEG